MSSARAARYRPRNGASGVAGCGHPVAPTPSSRAAAPFVGEQAYRAMLAELAATPKPGLVDRRDCGSHRDMGVGTLASSAAAIRPFLVRVAECARNAPAAAATLSAARRVGLEAEGAMFRATAGVNTHKGQIFVLVALISGAACRSGVLDPSARRRGTLLDSWRGAVRALTSGIVERELERLDRGHAASHGERLYLTYGVTGIRGEAERGFPAIFDIGLSAYGSMIDDGYTPNDAAVHALLAIMAVAEDTTVVHRGGPPALAFVRSSAAEAIGRGGMRTVTGRSFIDNLNERFIDRGLSPGGCADLLAGTIFVHSIAEAIGGECV